MSTWETEDEYGGSLTASEAILPTNSRRRASRRRSKTPPANRSTSPNMADSTDKAAKRSSRDISTDESISILDPRRFTPTLHANLVSEILTLKRDQEDKTKLIESLESNLHATKEEQERLQQNFATVSKESRSLKRQLSLLEGGTSSALGELARERDEAVDSVGETKKRLEVAQKKIRSQEDDSQRVHDLWAKEKDGWEDERRTYERKIHVAESRLKTILEEVAAYQAAHAHENGHSGPSHGHESDADDNQRDADAASIRTMSLTNSLRQSLVQSPGPMRGNGHSLADELNMDDETDTEATESVLSSPQHRRTMSRETVASRAHRRTQSIESLTRPESAARSRVFANPGVLDILEGDGEEEATILAAQPSTYTDTGVQYSPPPSPELGPLRPFAPPEPIASRTKALETESMSNDIEANQRKKRVQIGKPIVVEDTSPHLPMVSAAAQTMDEPLSPPWTPKLSSDPATPPSEEVEHPTTTSSATQTEETPQEDTEEPALPPVPSTVPLSIPSINIQPPTSRPTTPRSPRLPPHFKNFGCQVNISSDIPTSDAAVQTEGIQVDKRLARLPEHLRPSAISSRPSSPAKFGEEPNTSFTPLPGNLPPRNPLRLAGGRNSDDVTYPVGDDDEYLHYNDGEAPPALEESAMKRPQRVSSLFAGFDSASSDEAEDFQEPEASDSEFRTALTAPRPLSTSKRTSKRGSFGTASVSPEQVVWKQNIRGSVKPLSAEMYSPFMGSKDGAASHGRKPSRTYEKAPAPAPSVTGSNRTSDIRKAAMIQGSIASQYTRSRSPSLPDGQNPPFPIPTRDSSKRVPPSMRTSRTSSEGQRSPTRADIWHRRGSSSRSTYYGSNVRRVRSATALPRNQRYRRHGSRSPPPLSVSTEAPESPGLPPLPRNDITTPRGNERPHYRKHRHEMSTNTDNTLNTDPMSTSQGSTQTTGVVDAIAQTMVGEWMFKYVRRRKSFSVPDSTGKDDTGNDRHKRWVWLAPYERSILWSSKQPSSGSALMGKTGRKLTIQSVLDVKDDNPLPKGASTIFNRSILILTPQRALKFTAASSERHYLWLTALSFLAHSSQEVPENIGAPQPQVKKQQHQVLPEFEAPPAKIRKPGIRDSIRLAKGKSNANKMGPPSVPSIPSAPSSRMGDVASYRLAPSSATGSVNHNRDDSREAAVPPMIPRFSERASNGQGQPPSQGQAQPQTHVRKRSNTGSHVPPPISFRGFSGPAGSPSMNDGTNSTSIGTPASSDMYQSQASSNTTWGGSQRTSEASSRPSNFFDAIGTVRMEAFISPLAFSQMNDNPPEEEYRRAVRRRSKEIRRRSSRSRNRDSYSKRGFSRGIDDFYSGSRTAGEEEYFRDDPFRGF